MLAIVGIGKRCSNAAGYDIPPLIIEEGLTGSKTVKVYNVVEGPAGAKRLGWKTF